MKKAILKSKLILMVFSALLTFSCDGEDGMDGAVGPQGIQGEQGPPGTDGIDGVDGAQGEAGPSRFSIYTESGSLNTSSITATSTFQPIGPSLEITKEYDDSKIEIFFNSNCAGGTFGAGTTGVRFAVRINGITGTYGNDGAISASNSEEFISIFDVFNNLDAGEHSVQIYVRTNGGSSTGVILDPGGWGGKIIAKETF